MKLLFISALLIAWIPPMRSTPCKTVVRIKQEAMEYACQTQRISLQNAFGLISIPSVIQRKESGGLFGNGGLLGMGTSVVGGVLNIAGIKIHSVQLPEIDVKFMPNIGVQVSIDTSLHISARLVLVGEIAVKLGAGITAELLVLRTGKGLPIIEVSACKSLLGGIQITAGGKGLVPGIFDALRGHIQAILTDKLCVSVSNVFLGLNADLGLLVGAKRIGNDLGMQYIMPTPPVVNKDYMDMDMNVEYTVDEKVVDLPTGSKDFTLPPGAGNENSMVNMGFSKDFFISLFAAFQTSEGFDFEILPSSPTVGRYLKTSVLGSSIPEITQKYPRSLPVNIKIMLTQTPIVTLRSNQLIVQISPHVEFSVVMPNSRIQNLMAINVGANLLAKLEVKGGKLKTSVSLQGDLSLAMVSSSFGKDRCNLSVLAEFMRTVFEKAYLLQINADLSVGVTLPSLPNVQLTNEVMEVKEDYAVMSCDLQYVK
ncbi:BPI fold-containing family B member 2 [Bufo gargarizans]|uniref:BPI fold-containing family B member 2 n=1 Tax=Bufo gargarizans TaxID=30331 RepID=UPI001CF0E0ED|nr:BPI fold-containing family B member 2 [Bufo gargarizans]XP_044155308.1 BPI fold-containing family B member 2 [Bufo gargarizans]